MNKSPSKVAVVLCGSGYLDGSEIREAVGVLWGLSHVGAHVQCFAPDGPQHDVMNCLTAKPAVGEVRDMRVEAARIARGDVQPLGRLSASAFDALVLPGGFGAAKNLCDFAFKGSAGQVRPDLNEIIHAFFSAKKPIGAVCIAPAILALAIRSTSLTLTVGHPCDASREIEKLGHKHETCSVQECIVDPTHRIVTTPAYMYDNAKLSDIFEGIRKLTHTVVHEL